MKNRNENKAIKNSCHSRMFLSGIYNDCCYDTAKSGITIKKVILNLIQDLTLGIKAVRFQIKFAMTSLVNNRGFTTARSVTPQGRYAGYSGRTGFTLIELLVVVLIIGVLAAVALPQYQKAVEKIRSTQAATLLKSISEATKIYEEQTGAWPSSFDELDVSIPAEFQPVEPSRGPGYNSVDTRSNGTWEIQLEKYGTQHKKIFIFRTDGRYEGSGFMYARGGMNPESLHKKIHCFESWPKNQRPDDVGKYCKKLLGCGDPNALGSTWWTFPY